MDIRELRIGNSVLVNGVRAKVIEIKDTHFGYWIRIEGFSPDLDRIARVGIFINDDGVQPIPLTEELLKELGFEEEKEPEEGWYYGIEKVFMKEFDSPIEEDYYISLDQYEGGLYQLQVLGTIAYVRNLHELESYVYLTTKKELI